MNAPGSSTRKLKEAFSAVDEERDYITTVLQDLIRIDTSCPPGKNYEKVADYLEPIFEKLQYETERVIEPESEVKQIPLRLEGPRVNLVTKKKYGHDPVSVYAHIDVVPVEEAWSMDPFKGIVKDGRVYGRGALDMKGSIASLIGALKVIDSAKLEPRFDITCLFCTDEEIGVFPGIYYLVRQGYVKGHVLCLESAGQEPFLCTGMLGKVDFIITVTGRSVHSASSFFGINAVEESAPIIADLLNLKKDVETRQSKIPAFPGTGPSDKLSPVLNINLIRGGVKSNIVPSSCEITLERRYLPEENYDSVVREIVQTTEKARNKSKALDVKVNVVHVYPPYTVDPNCMPMIRSKEAIRSVHNYRDEEFVYGGVFASSDMAFVSKVMKTDQFGSLGPSRVDNRSAHGADEYVNIDDLVALSKQIVYYLVA